MITGVTFILLKPNGQILMQLRDDGNGKQIKYPNMWCFPGGGIEKHEKPIEAILREIGEEYEQKIDEKQCKFLCIYKHDGDIKDWVFVCRVTDDFSPTLNEGAEMKWMDLSEIEKLKLAWEQDLILDRLRKYLAV